MKKNNSTTNGHQNCVASSSARNVILSGEEWLASWELCKNVALKHAWARKDSRFGYEACEDLASDALTKVVELSYVETMEQRIERLGYQDMTPVKHVKGKGYVIRTMGLNDESHARGTMVNKTKWAVVDKTRSYATANPRDCESVFCKGSNTYIDADGKTTDYLDAGSSKGFGVGPTEECAVEREAYERNCEDIKRLVALLPEKQGLALYAVQNVDKGTVNGKTQYQRASEFLLKEGIKKDANWISEQMRAIRKREDMRNFKKNNIIADN